MAIGRFENMFEMEVAKAVPIDWTAVRLLEMGSIKRKCNMISEDIVQNHNLAHMKELGLYPRCAAKCYYLQILGVVEHVSIDLNGVWESLKLDLDYPLPEHFCEHFNLITNYGTGEHVNNQHSFFSNVHNCCKVGGIMIHALNAPGYVVGHGRYEYPSSFSAILAKMCNYDIVASRSGGFYKQKYARKTDHWYDKVNFIAFSKTKGVPFIGSSEFDTLAIVDTGFTARTGNYNTRKAKSRVRKLIAKQKRHLQKKARNK